MFGNRKMYKKGLADALQANEGFSEKQREALEKMRKDVESGQKRLEDALDSLGDELSGVYQYLNGKEKAALYHLSTPIDVKTLAIEEQQLLIAVLYQLGVEEGSRLTDYQRKYLSSIQRYLAITNPQPQADLSVVADIDSVEVQKAFMQVTLEFLYLQDGEELTDEQEEFLGNFSVNKKQALAIEEMVSRLYNAVGALGLSEKYGAQADEQFSPDAIAEKMKKLEVCIAELGKSSAAIVTHVVVDIDFNKISVCSADDSVSFKDKSRCQQSAERELERYHRKFEKEIEDKVKESKEDSIYASFAGSFKVRIDWVKEALSKLRMPATVDIVNQMATLLNTADFLNKVSGEYGKMESKYHLSNVGTYRSDITYDSYDPSEFETGLAKLIMKASMRYGFNILGAIHSMQRDAIACLENYQEDFNYQVERLISSTYIEPLEKLLPQLQDALSKPSE